MKDIIQILTAVIFVSVLSLINTKTAFANEKEAGASAQLKPYLLGKDPDKTDKQIKILHDYLEQFNSPLANDAETFILIADQQEFDWTFLPAIAGAESTFGRRILYNSYNPFGWAGGTYMFNNWQHAIVTVGEALRRKYMDGWGVTTVEQIAPIYAPPSRTWARNVRFFMHDIKNFEKNRSSLALNISL